MSEEITIQSVDLPRLVHAASILVDGGQREEAIGLYASWVAAHEGHPLRFAALFNLSALRGEAGDAAGAMEALQAAIHLNPDFLGAYINLGRLLEQSKDPEGALKTWYAGVDRPLVVTGTNVGHVVTALKQIARLHMEREEQAEAERALVRCLSIAPNEDDALEQYLALRMREWQRPVLQPVEGLDGKAMLARFHPLSVAAFTDDPYFQLASTHAYAQRLTGGLVPPRDCDRRDAPIEAGRRLRVGYLSSDLRDHAIGYLMSEFFEVHDREEIETFAYFTGAAPTSAITERIQAAVEHFVDIRAVDDDAAARRIASDGIDILVDVNGHTRDARLGVFARRPAPIQVNWLGYPGTMGTPYHHYVIADAFIAPPGSERYFSEKVLRLPCYQPNDRKRVVAERPARAATGLPEGKFVFASFNALHKITPFTMDRWIEILTAVPDSVMWMLDCSAQTKSTIAAYLGARGFDPARFVYAPKLANPHHLARYPHADLFLDALPYGAHTTASDALFMGVPVLTLAGRCFASRVCGSLVTSAGLPDFVTTRPEDYVAKAVAIAGEPSALADAKARLDAARSTCVLFDQELLANSLRDLYQEIAADHRAGRLPRPNLKNLQAYLAAAVADDHEGRELSFDPDYEARFRARLEEIDRLAPLEPDERLWDKAR